jgi:hypothetical protein
MQMLSSISDWHDHVRAGAQYIQTAVGGLQRREVFTNELVFQLAAMGIEKIIVGLCQYYGRMPSDHTLSGLLTDLAAVRPLDEALAERVRRVEMIDDMCTLDAERRIPPGDIEVQLALLTGREVAVFARQHVPWDAIGPLAERNEDIRGADWSQGALSNIEPKKG